MTMYTEEYEVVSDGRTVWVNASSGCCLGRFGSSGLDIHRDVDGQVAVGACLHCTHSRPTSADWETFVREMREFYDVEVREEHKPKWLEK